MTKQEAYRLLHPDTTGQAVKELEYYGGFTGRLAVIKEIEAACLVACECIQESIDQEWKPCSEKPEDKEEVLVAVFDHLSKE